MKNIDERVSELTSKIQSISTDTVQKPTLLYLDIIGIGWPIRVLFDVMGVDIEDVRISFPVWLEIKEKFRTQLKGKFRNRHVPRYVDNNVDLQQSVVILQYLGRKYELFGDTPKEELMIQEILCHAYDCIFHFTGMFNANFKGSSNKKPTKYFKENLKNFLGEDGGFQKNMHVFQDYLDANTNNSDFIVGARLSIADLVTFNILCNWYKSFDRYLFLSKFPKLETYVQRIAQNSMIRNYIKTKQSATTWLPGQWGQLLGYKLTTPEELDGLVSNL